MTEDAKKDSAPIEDAEHTEEKGRAKDKEDIKDDEAKSTENAESQEGEAKEGERSEQKDSNNSTTSVENEKDDKKGDESKDKDSVDTIEIEIKADRDKNNREKFQAEIRDQIDNCKFEIISELQERIHDEMGHFEKHARNIERRRRTGFIIRDVIILILAAIIGFLSYCLYDAKYFGFMRPECEKNDNCEVATEQKDPEVKNAEWYKQNYGYLFDSLQTKLDADKVNAYYLYTGDYKVNEIEPEYLLGMAYNRLNSNITYDSSDGIVVPAGDLKQAYIDLTGSANSFTKTSFTYHCANFQYRKDSDDFMAKSLLCADTSDRKILEEIDEIYEEGNVLYFLTTATIYDKVNDSFYSFDNLFKPVAKNVTEDDLEKNKGLLNQYQYQFKKSNGQYHFGGVVKLK